MSTKPAVPAVRLVSDSTMLVRVQARTGHVEMTTQIPPGLTSPNVFAADCAVALERLGTPVFRFVQLHPAREDLAVKILHVRFSWEAFKRQSKITIPFREKVEAAMQTGRTQDATALGRFADLARKVATDSSTQTLVIDADFDLAAHHGSRCSILYLDFDPREAANAAHGRVHEIRFRAIASVTLPSAAMVDLINSWEALIPEGER